MKTLKKLIALAAATTMLTGTSVMAVEEDACEEGVAYYEAYSCSFLTPTIGLGVVAIAAIVAVAINNSDKGGAHSH